MTKDSPSSLALYCVRLYLIDLPSRSSLDGSISPAMRRLSESPLDPPPQTPTRLDMGLHIRQTISRKVPSIAEVNDSPHKYMVSDEIGVNAMLCETHYIRSSTPLVIQDIQPRRTIIPISFFSSITAPSSPPHQPAQHPSYKQGAPVSPQ